MLPLPLPSRPTPDTCAPPPGEESSTHRICPSCREERPTPPLLQRYGVERVWQGRGCDHCRHTGYRGRVGLYEQFVSSEDIADAIARGASGAELRDLARAGGLVTLWEQGLERVKEGTTTPDELTRVAGQEA